MSATTGVIEDTCISCSIRVTLMARPS